MVAPRILAALTAVTLAVSASAAAGAHVEPTQTEVAAGSTADVGFVPEHDCDGSPTVRVDIQSPESVTDPEPVDQAGWISSVDGRVVTYEWEGVGGENPGGFAVRFTVPDRPGETLLFPTVQTCAEGSIDWIQTETEGDRPAPRVTVIGSDQTPTTAAQDPAPETSDATEPEGTDETTDTTYDPSEDTSEDQDSEDGDSNTALSVVLGVVVATGVAGGAVYLRRRSQG